MDDILSLILILDEDQYDRLGRQIDNWSSVYYMVEEYKYQIKNLDYYVVELAVESYYYEAKDVIRFLANSIEYYAMRVAGSKDIFIRNYGDLIDLKEDCYKTESAVHLVKDMMSNEERFDSIFDCNSYFLPTDSLLLMTDPFNSVELDATTDELFSEEEEFTVCNAFTGEVHTVDLTIGIDPRNFSIVILDKTV